jgi:preprotein translocase subunit SecE
METENTKNEKAELKEENKKVESKAKKFGLSDWFEVHKAEFKKISWPTRQVLAKETVTVIIISLFVGAVIFCYDEALSFLFQKFISMFS